MFIGFLCPLSPSPASAANPEHILLTSDLKFDPVWSLLRLQPLTGTGRYDPLGALLRAALDASPSGTGRYDPLGLLLRAKPLSGSHTYDPLSALLATRVPTGTHTGDVAQVRACTHVWRVARALRGAPWAAFLGQIWLLGRAAMQSKLADARGDSRRGHCLHE